MDTAITKRAHTHLTKTNVRQHQYKTKTQATSATATTKRYRMHKELAIALDFGPHLIGPRDLSLLHHRVRVDVDKPRCVGQNQLSLLGGEAHPFHHQTHVDNELVRQQELGPIIPASETPRL